MINRKSLLTIGVVAALTSASAAAETFRWAFQGDVATLDPHGKSRGPPRDHATALRTGDQDSGATTQLTSLLRWSSDASAMRSTLTH